MQFILRKLKHVIVIQIIIIKVRQINVNVFLIMDTPQFIIMIKIILNVIFAHLDAAVILQDAIIVFLILLDIV
jgi:hypothetical protein